MIGNVQTTVPTQQYVPTQPMMQPQQYIPTQPMVPQQQYLPTQPQQYVPTQPQQYLPTQPQPYLPTQPVVPQQPQQFLPTQPVVPPPQQWRKKFPSILAGIFAFLQCVITIVIIGCEVGGILIDMVTATIYVGLWAGLFFICAWISLAGASCCCHERGCATYTLVIQCISLFFAACVIGFDSYYLVYPTTCFFSSSVCSSTSSSVRGVFYTDANFNNIKIPLIKGQLAAGCVMFVLCLIYIIIYIVTSVRISHDKTASSVYPQPPYSLPMVPTGPDGMMMAPPVANIRPTRAASPLYHRPTMVIDNGEGRTNDLLCPTCSTMMNVSVRKRPPQ